jgi:hypothetical protein
LCLKRAILLKTIGHNLSNWALQPVGLPFFILNIIKMKNIKKGSILFAVAFAVFLAAFFYPKKTKAFEDNTPPSLTSYGITPLEIDTSEQNQTLTLTMTVKDNDGGVGVCLYRDPGDCNGESSPLNKSQLTVYYQPLIGTQQLNFSNFQRISGDDSEGTYQATATLPRGSKVGIWQEGQIYLLDKLGNYRNYWMGYPSSGYNETYRPPSEIPNASGLIIANTATSASVRIEKEWTLSSSNVSAKFSADTVVTKKEGGSFAFYKMVNQDFNIGDITTDGLDTTNTNNIAGKVKIGIPGLNLSFSKPVTLAFDVGSQYEGQVLEIQTLEENGGSWANETTCTVSSGKCSFTVNHASYFAAIKKTASSTSNGTVAGSINGNIVIGTDTPTLNYSTSKKAKRNITLTFSGLSLTKKQWIKVWLNGRKVTTARVSRGGNDSIVTISFKYGKWPTGNYNFAMTYKNQIKVPYIKKGKTKYRKGWESGSVTSENILSIL